MPTYRLRKDYDNTVAWFEARNNSHAVRLMRKKFPNIRRLDIERRDGMFWQSIVSNSPFVVRSTKRK